MPEREELEIITEYNLRDLAYYQEEARQLQKAVEAGRHGGDGPEVEDGETDE